MVDRNVVRKAEALHGMLEPLCHPLQRVTGVANTVLAGYYRITRKTGLLFFFVSVEIII